MKHEKMSYEDALAEATELGFAEADPSADVDGIDAARKMVILASLSFSTEVRLDDVFVRGTERNPRRRFGTCGAIRLHGEVGRICPKGRGWY